MSKSSAPNSATRIEIDGDIATLFLDRPEKRNAIDAALVDELGAFFSNPPEEVNAVVLTSSSDHFCSGLDLAEHEHREPIANVYHSRHWHGIMDLMEYGRIPVLSAMSGAVIGGGLEIALSTHVRIAEPSVIFQLPEGRRGIFVGGSATVRAGRILGADRMREMMLTGRKYDAEEGVRLGLAHYAVGKGESLSLARELARKIADNAPFANYLMMQAIPNIDDMPRQAGLFTESLAAAMSQTSDEAKEGLRAFLEKREPKFR